MRCHSPTSSSSATAFPSRGPSGEGALHALNAALHLICALPLSTPCDSLTAASADIICSCARRSVTRRLKSECVGRESRSAIPLHRALQLAAESDGMLVVGSSLMVSKPVVGPVVFCICVSNRATCKVASFRELEFEPATAPQSSASLLQVYSAFRLARAAKEAGAKVAAVCVGPTRADDFLDLKVSFAVGDETWTTSYFVPCPPLFVLVETGTPAARNVCSILQRVRRTTTVRQ